MSLRAFTEESREEVVKSMVNWSVSKQMWSFPKKKRFLAKKPECPQSAYQHNLSTITHKCITFATSTRDLFNDTRHNPSPANYQQPAATPKQVPLFAQSREVLPPLPRPSSSTPTSRSNSPAYFPLHAAPGARQIRERRAEGQQEGLHDASEDGQPPQLYPPC